MCLPRVSYRALPSLHPGLCRSIALKGLTYAHVMDSLNPFYDRLVGGGRVHCQIGLRSLHVRWVGYVGVWKWVYVKIGMGMIGVYLCDWDLVSEAERAL